MKLEENKRYQEIVDMSTKLNIYRELGVDPSDIEREFSEEINHLVSIQGNEYAGIESLGSAFAAALLANRYEHLER